MEGEEKKKEKEKGVRGRGGWMRHCEISTDEDLYLHVLKEEERDGPIH